MERRYDIKEKLDLPVYDIPFRPGSLLQDEISQKQSAPNIVCFNIQVMRILDMSHDKGSRTKPLNTVHVIV